MYIVKYLAQVHIAKDARACEYTNADINIKSASFSSLTLLHLLRKFSIIILRICFLKVADQR